MIIRNLFLLNLFSLVLRIIRLGLLDAILKCLFIVLKSFSLGSDHLLRVQRANGIAHVLPILFVGAAASEFVLDFPFAGATRLLIAGGQT